jgi:hypothetical protein
LREYDKTGTGVKAQTSGVIPAKAGIPVVFAFAFPLSLSLKKKTAESGERLIINRDSRLRGNDTVGLGICPNNIVSAATVTFFLLLPSQCSPKHWVIPETPLSKPSPTVSFPRRRSYLAAFYADKLLKNHIFTEMKTFSSLSLKKKTAESGKRLIINRDCGFRRNDTRGFLLFAFSILLFPLTLNSQELFGSVLRCQITQELFGSVLRCQITQFTFNYPYRFLNR